MSEQPTWDPGCYLQHADSRSRPFRDLLDRIPATRPSRVVDLGCGPGNVTALLLTRWPDAHVTGIDSSAAMLEAAQQHAGAASSGTGRLDFRLDDVRTYSPRDDGAVDVLVSNAALHWVPNHDSLLPHWMEALSDGGVLAFQVPGNFEAPNHTLLAELRNSPQWRSVLGDDTPVGQHTPSVRGPVDYLRLFASRGYSTDVWETTYYYVLTGERAVLEWMMGSVLRPVLTALQPDDRDAFLRSYQALLDRAYRPEAFGTVLPYRRIFVVATKSG